MRRFWNILIRRCLRLKIPCPAIGTFRRNGIGVSPQRKEADRRVKICEARLLASDPFFKVVNVAADFSALEAKCGYNVKLDHATKAGDGRLEILVAVAP